MVIVLIFYYADVIISIAQGLIPVTIKQYEDLGKNNEQEKRNYQSYNRICRCYAGIVRCGVIQSVCADVAAAGNENGGHDTDLLADSVNSHYCDAGE